MKLVEEFVQDSPDGSVVRFVSTADGHAGHRGF
jgi:hypothetical protein